MLKGLTATLIVAGLAGSAQADDEKIKVQWKGKWYPASVKSKDDAKKCWNIHYDGFEASWDECVGRDRIQGLKEAVSFPSGSKVKVLWKGTWYGATVKSVDTGKACWAIHYDGFEASWDECVKRDRIK